VEASNSCAGTLIFGSFFFIAFCQSFFPPLFAFFLLSVLLSFLLLSNWFLFLSSFVFPLLFRYCFIPVSLAHVVSSLAYPNLLGTKRLGCCCCCILCKNRQTNDVMFKNNVWTFCENYEREGNANVETKTSWNYNGSFHIRGGVIYHLPLTPLAPKTNRRA
jgi:hypothetical protein